MVEPAVAVQRAGARIVTEAAGADLVGGMQFFVFGDHRKCDAGRNAAHGRCKGALQEPGTVDIIGVIAVSDMDAAVAEGDSIGGQGEILA